LIGRVRRADPTLLAIVGEGFFSRLSFGILSFALPLYALELGMSVALIGLLASLNLMVALLLKPLTGRLADRIGLKVSLTAAIAIRSAVSFLLIFVSVPWQLFATRSLHGVAIALRDPATGALIAERATKERLAQSFAWYQTAKSSAGSIGRVLGGLLVAAAAALGTWSVVFGVAFLFSTIPLYLVVRYVAEPALGEGEGAATEEVPTVERPIDAAAAGPSGWRRRALRVAAAGGMIGGTGHMLSALFPILATQYAGLSPAVAGLLYAVSGVIALLGPAFGWVSDNVSRKLVLQFRSIANVASSAIYLVAPGFAGFAAGKALDDAGKAAFKPAWGALMAEASELDRGRRAQMIGYMSSGEDAGEMSGPLLAGALWSLGGPPAVLVTRIALAIGAECYTVRVMREMEEWHSPDRGAAEHGALARRPQPVSEARPGFSLPAADVQQPRQAVP